MKHSMFSENQNGARHAQIFNLTGKTAVVTGPAQGLGRETTRLLAEAGANVVIADLNPDAACATAADTIGQLIGHESRLRQAESARTSHNATPPFCVALAASSVAATVRRHTTDRRDCDAHASPRV
jgi:NAD(P)-dependent dehydrogenase (short-subunit alcohol dehydrogenase family)